MQALWRNESTEWSASSPGHFTQAEGLMQFQTSSVKFEGDKQFQTSSVEFEGDKQFQTSSVKFEGDKSLMAMPGNRTPIPRSFIM